MAGGTQMGARAMGGSWADGMPWRFIAFGGAFIALLMGWHLHRTHDPGFAVPTPAMANAVAGVTDGAAVAAAEPAAALRPRHVDRAARPAPAGVAVELQSEALTVVDETDVVVSEPVPAPQVIVVVQQAAPAPAPLPYPVARVGVLGGAPQPHRRVMGPNVTGLTPQRGALPGAPRGNRAPSQARSRSATGGSRRVSRQARPSSSPRR